MPLVQLTKKDISTLRDKWYKEQGGKCPILGIKIDPKNATLDHLHKLKKELPDETGKGCCRGVLHFQANSWEGRVTSSYKRSGLEKHLTLPEALKNLAQYLEKNRIHEDIKYIHPNEKPKSVVVTLSSYNKLKRVCTVTLPPYGKGFNSLKLQALFKKYDVTPKYYKNGKSK